MRAKLDFPAGAGPRLRLDFAQPQAVLKATRPEEVTAVIAAAEAQARAGRWVLGFVTYEAAAAFDPALRTHAPTPPLPLAIFAAYDAPASVADAGTGDFHCGPWRLALPRHRIDAAVETIRKGITAGDYYQINLTAQLEATWEGDAAALFEALRRAQPDAHGAYFNGGDWQVLSVSPELFFDWRTDGHLTAQPMKGTAPRHADADADAAAATRLRTTEKELAENLMIVDLLRNDLSRVAVTGSVAVPRLFEVAALATAWQMTSTVTCATRPEVGLADIFGALFPCGSVTGAPKVAAMAAIADLEDGPRGIYCGAVGLIRPGGHATFSVGIRTVLIDHQRQRATCGIGSGITLDSTADAEYAEWLVKRRFLLRASASFALIETLRLEDGRYWLEAGHLARLQGSAEHFGFDLTATTVPAALAEVARNHPTGAWKVRLQLDRQGRIETECHALDAAPEEIIIALATAPVASNDEFLGHKTTVREAYTRHAPPAGVFDTLLWNERDELTEFTRGNVVVELDGRRLTPPLSCGLLPGVLRADLLARGEIREEVITRQTLSRASGFWFINSVRGWLPARLPSPH